MPQMLVYFFRVTYKMQRTFYQQTYGVDIQKAINPKDIINRYDRDWRFSKPTTKGDYLMGKFGFVRKGKEEIGDYDEEQQDFVRQTIDAKQTTWVLYIVDLDSHVLAFEAKPPLIYYQSFKGAFQKNLDTNYPELNLMVEDFVQTSRFLAWVRDEVDKVTSFKASLRARNPNYSRDPKFIQRLMGETNADRARLELGKLKDSTDSLNTGTVINDVVTYGEEGYSSIIARGKRGEQVKIFDSSRKTLSHRVDVGKDISDALKWEKMIEVLRRFLK
ncbi:MAG: hypothetical protein R6U93_05890 [Dehalococcoidia bacterium]